MLISVLGPKLEVQIESERGKKKPPQSRRLSSCQKTARPKLLGVAEELAIKRDPAARRSWGTATVGVPKVPFCSG